MIRLTPTKLNKLLKEMGCHERISKDEWKFNSIAGVLYIKFIDNDFVHMKFLDKDKANEKLDSTLRKKLTPLSGKYNFHWDKNECFNYKIAELSSYLTNLIYWEKK